jgi:hypothetical protein
MALPRSQAYLFTGLPELLDVALPTYPWIRRSGEKISPPAQATSPFWGSSLMELAGRLSNSDFLARVESLLAQIQKDRDSHGETT